MTPSLPTRVWLGLACLTLPLLAADPVDPKALSRPLQFWVRGDSLNALAPGAPVSTWTDSSGNGRNALALPTREPLYFPDLINGQPGVRFSGALPDQHLEFALPIGLSNSFTAIVVFQSQALQAESIITAATTPGDSFFPLFYMEDQTPSGGTVHTVGQYASSFAIGQPYQKGSWIIETMVLDFSRGVLEMHQNGKLESATRTASGGVARNVSDSAFEEPIPGSWRIAGGYTGIFGLNGEIAELLLFQGSLAPQEKDALEKQLGTKYAIEVPQLELLLLDDFNAANSASPNPTSLRQKGTLKGTPYVAATEGTARIEGNRLRLNNRATGATAGANTLSPDLDFAPFEQGRSFRLRATLIPSRGMTLTGVYSGLSFGGSQKNQLPRETDGVGFLIHQNGTATLLVGGFEVIPTFAVPAAPYYDVEAQVTDGRLRMYVNGQLMVGAGANSEFTLPSTSQHYVTFSNLGDAGTEGVPATFVDNFIFNSPPKPPPAPQITLTVERLIDGGVRIRWPSQGDFVLMESDNAEGPYRFSPLLRLDDGSGFYYSDDTTAELRTRFYRTTQL